MEPVQLLFVLLFLGGPQDQETGARLAQALQDSYEQQLTVVLPPQSSEKIEAYGVGIQDIQAPSSNIGQLLTKQDSRLVIIHLETSEAYGDTMITSQLWLNGRKEGHVAIAGEGGDPFDNMYRGVHNFIRPLLNPSRLTQIQAQGAQLVVPRQDPAQLAGLNEWAQIVSMLQAYPPENAREAYYLVLAHCRMDNRAAAVAALTAMEQAFPQHFLAAAARELIPAPAIGEQPAATQFSAQEDILTDANYSEQASRPLLSVPNSDLATPVEDK